MNTQFPEMARTKQTAAVSASSRARKQRLFGNGTDPEVQVDDGQIEIDDETKARRKEIEEGEMRAELKLVSSLCEVPLTEEIC